jgi:hypothetical protein
MVTGCLIEGYSESVTSTADTFRIDENKKRISLDFVGQGPVELIFPDDLLPPGNDTKIYNVISNDNGRRFDYKVSNQTLTILHSLPFFPRSFALFYGPDLVPASKLELNPASAYVGRQSLIELSLANYVEFYQPYVAIVEVRDDSGITSFMGNQSGVLMPDPDGKADNGMWWTPNKAGDHEIRVFVISNLNANLTSPAPEILSTVRSLNVNVSAANLDPQFSSAPNYNVSDTVTVTILDDFSNRNATKDDEITQIRITSSSDMVGEEFTAEETGGNTGIFELVFTLSASGGAGSIAVNSGDTVTIEFSDERNRDFTYTILVD